MPLTLTKTHTHTFADGESVTKSMDMEFDDHHPDNHEQRVELVFNHPTTAEQHTHDLVFRKSDADGEKTKTTEHSG